MIIINFYLRKDEDELKSPMNQGFIQSNESFDLDKINE